MPTKSQLREDYINWAATQVALSEDGHASVPSSAVWRKQGDKHYTIEIDETGMVIHCNCPHHDVWRLSCKHMLAYERWQMVCL